MEVDRRDVALVRSVSHEKLVIPFPILVAGTAFYILLCAQICMKLLSREPDIIKLALRRTDRIAETGQPTGIKTFKLFANAPHGTASNPKKLKKFSEQVAYQELGKDLPFDGIITATDGETGQTYTAALTYRPRIIRRPVPEDYRRVNVRKTDYAKTGKKLVGYLGTLLENYEANTKGTSRKTKPKSGKSRQKTRRS